MNRFDEAQSLLDAEWSAWQREAQEQPEIDVFDKNWEYVAPVSGVIAGNAEEIVNDSGEVEWAMHADFPVARWAADEVPEGEDIHVRIRQSGNVWTGKVSVVDESMDSSGVEVVKFEGLHDMQHAKKLYCFPNPWFGASLQWPKIYIWYGAVRTGLLQMKMLNLIRRYQPGFVPIGGIFSPFNYGRLDIDNWAQIVDPRGLGMEDTSMHTMIVTRMGQFMEIARPMLEDASERLVARRWLPGDPQPFPEYCTLRFPTLIWSIEPMGGLRGPTGTMVDGLIQLVRSIASDGITETTEAVPYDPPIEYRDVGWGTKVASPAVVFYRAQRWTRMEGSGQVGVRSWKRRVHKALATSIITGGRSPGWVNSGIKMLVNAALGWIGMIFLNPGLTLGVLDDQVEDVVLAFAQWPFMDRAAVMGRDAFGEAWETSGGTGFSLSTIAAIRQGRTATRAYTSYQIEAINGAPYIVGRHMDIGSPVSAEVGRTGRLYTDTLRSKRIEFSPGEVQWVLAIGVDNEERSPAARLGRILESVRTVTQNLSVQS